VLQEAGPPLTYFPAGMVVGAGSESYKTLRYLVARLPVIIAPASLRNASQPIAAADAVAYPVGALEKEATVGREIEIGGLDRLSYGEKLDWLAIALGRAPPPADPRTRSHPRLSSLWIGLVTPVDAGVARPLIESDAVPTGVRDEGGMALFPEIEPVGFDQALRRALEEGAEAGGGRTAAQ